jgi:hypothetical protein
VGGASGLYERLQPGHDLVDPEGAEHPEGVGKPVLVEGVQVLGEHVAHLLVIQAPRRVDGQPLQDAGHRQGLKPGEDAQDRRSVRATAMELEGLERSLRHPVLRVDGQGEHAIHGRGGVPTPLPIGQGR